MLTTRTLDEHGLETKALYGATVDSQGPEAQGEEAAAGEEATGEEAAGEEAAAAAAAQQEMRSSLDSQFPNMAPPGMVRVRVRVRVRVSPNPSPNPNNSTYRSSARRYCTHRGRDEEVAHLPYRG